MSQTNPNHSESRLRALESSYAGLEAELRAFREVLEEVRTDMRDVVRSTGSLNVLKDRLDRVETGLDRHLDKIEGMEKQIHRWHYPLTILIIAFMIGGLTIFGISKSDAADLIERATEIHSGGDHYDIP